MVVAAYGLILPKAVLQMPRQGCLNIHASLLPRWRGAAPIQRAILAGDAETGITIMQMDEGLDTGDMLLKRICPIEPDDTAQTLHDKLAELGAQAIIEALQKMEQRQAASGTARHATSDLCRQIDQERSATGLESGCDATGTRGTRIFSVSDSICIIRRNADQDIAGEHWAKARKQCPERSSRWIKSAFLSHAAKARSRWRYCRNPAARRCLLHNSYKAFPSRSAIALVRTDHATYPTRSSQNSKQSRARRAQPYSGVK